MLFACLFVPVFPVAAVVRLAPELRDRAVAVLEGVPPLSKVIAANQKALAAGIELRMTKLQAEACTGVVLCQRSLQQESSAHAALLDCAQVFSPRAENIQSEFNDTVVLDIAGCGKLLGSPEQIAKSLQEHAAKLGFASHIAVAGNLEAAILAARGFAGSTVIPGGEEAPRLSVLPVSTLQTAPEVLETLARWGIRTLGQFAALPDVAVVERLGQEGRRLQILARGADPRPLIAKESKLLFEEMVELEYPAELLEQLLFVLNRMLEQLCARLAMRALATNEIKLTLVLEKVHSAQKQNGIYMRSLRLPIPSQDSKVFLKLFHLDLQAVPPCAPILSVKLVAEPARPRAAQEGLFLPRSPEPERLEITLARIRNMVGESRVGSPALLDTHSPNAFRMDRFLAREASIALNSTEAERPRTMLRMFRPPTAAHVELMNRVPSRISSPMVCGDVLGTAGPWRTTGNWWSETGWACDEWDVLLSTVLCRIYQELRTGQWFIQGIYD
jgi:protein ImuB